MIRYAFCRGTFQTSSITYVMFRSVELTYPVSIVLGVSLMPLGEGILAGRRILIVEDEYFLADDLRQILHEHHAETLGPASTIAKALALINAGGRIDCAVLDLNLRGQVAYPISAALHQRKIPFLFATGYGSACA